jgi:LmbE family N-acetylglucosaminyl deacetylase
MGSIGPMKPTPKPPSELPSLLAFGAHPDDVEFGCGAVIAQHTRAGRSAHVVVCSRGEAASHGRPEDRVAEARRGAALLGATIEFLELDGDAHLEVRAAHALTLAGVLRQMRPRLVLAPCLAKNQHPDHWRLGRLVGDAARLARFGGVQELSAWAPHSIELLLHYALSRESEPRSVAPVLIDVSARDLVDVWVAAMEAHGSQTAARRYVELQLTRARLHGLGAGVEHAIPLYPADPLVFTSLAELGRGARAF